MLYIKCMQLVQIGPQGLAMDAPNARAGIAARDHVSSECDCPPAPWKVTVNVFGCFDATFRYFLDIFYIFWSQKCQFSVFWLVFFGYFWLAILVLPSEGYQFSSAMAWREARCSERGAGCSHIAAEKSSAARPERQTRRRDRQDGWTYLYWTWTKGWNMNPQQLQAK